MRRKTKLQKVLDKFLNKCLVIDTEMSGQDRIVVKAPYIKSDIKTFNKIASELVREAISGDNK